MSAHPMYMLIVVSHPWLSVADAFPPPVAGPTPMYPQAPNGAPPQDGTPYPPGPGMYPPTAMPMDNKEGIPVYPPAPAGRDYQLILFEAVTLFNNTALCVQLISIVIKVMVNKPLIYISSGIYISLCIVPDRWSPDVSCSTGCRSPVP